VKLGNDAGDTCAMLSVAYGERLSKSHVFLNGVNGSKRVTRNEDKAHHFLRYQGYCSLWAHSARLNSQL